MTIIELREIAAASGLQYAEFCLEQHTSQVGRDAADPLWIEMSRLVMEHADKYGGTCLGGLDDA